MTPRGSRLPARWISADVLDRAQAAIACGRVVARFDSAVYADLGGWTLALTPAALPRMPNGITVAAAFGGPAWPQVGDRARLGEGVLSLGRLSIVWDAARPPRWDPQVPLWDAGRERLYDRAKLVLASCTGRAGPFEPGGAMRRVGGFHADDDVAANGLESLLSAIRGRDPLAAAGAARELVGRGSGLTPVGDDVLAAAALTVASAGASCGFGPAARRAWLAALEPPDLRARTTSVSATMLELAIRGRGLEPTHALLDPRLAATARVSAAVRRILRLGHTTGPAYGIAIGACALTLAESGQSTNHRTRRTSHERQSEPRPGPVTGLLDAHPGVRRLRLA